MLAHRVLYVSGLDLFLGTLKHTYTISQLILADLTKSGKRTVQLGLLSSIGSAGFLVGNGLGAAVSGHFGLRSPVLLCAAVYLTNCCLIALIRTEKSSQYISKRNTISSSLKQWRLLYKGEHTRELLLISLASTFSMMLVYTSYTFLLQFRFGLEASQSSVVTMARHIVSICSKLLLLPLVRNFYSDRILLQISVQILAILYFLVGICDNFIIFLLFLLISDTVDSWIGITTKSLFTQYLPKYMKFLYIYTFLFFV